MEFYDCARCGRSNRIPYRCLHADRHRVVIERCTRCGAAHSILSGWAQVVSQPIKPFDHDKVPSAWIPAPACPVEEGFYQTRFHELEPHTVRLWWDGRAFYTTDMRARVQLDSYMGYRGSL